MDDERLDRVIDSNLAVLVADIILAVIFLLRKIVLGIEPGFLRWPVTLPNVILVAGSLFLFDAVVWVGAYYWKDLLRVRR